MPVNIIQNIQTHFNICEDNPDNIRSILGSSTVKVAELKSFCKDVLKVKRLTGLKKNDFVEIIKIALIDNVEEDLELEPFPPRESSQQPDSIINDLSNFEVNTDDEASASEDDESDDEELTQINLPPLFTRVDRTENDLTNLCKTAKLTIILVHSTHCEPCEKFMPKYKKFVEECQTDIVNFGLLEVDTYTRNVREIPEDEISELPAIQFYKNGECVKTMYGPTKGKIEKSITSLTKKSIKDLKEECKSRGLSLSGKKDQLENRLKEDDEKGWKLHTKSKAELIEYLITTLKSKSNKYDEMDSISLIKKIRKVSDKKFLESELRYEKLIERFEGEDQKKVMMKMTVKQLRVLVDHGFSARTAPSFECFTHENEAGETVKALTKNEIISKFMETA
jgi:thioredoxin-like negative regulator of GroEL